MTDRLRRVKKFPSASVLERNLTFSVDDPPVPTVLSPPATPATPNAPPTPTPSRGPPKQKYFTLSSGTRPAHPIIRTRRSASQSQFDAPKFAVHHHHSRSESAPRAVARKSTSAQQLVGDAPTTIEGLLSQKPSTENVKEMLADLRYLILTQGIKADAEGNSPLRIYIWSILLGTPPMRTTDYVNLVRRGASSSYSKIRNDTFRTLATDPLFRRRVSEASLIRLLNSFQWHQKDAGSDSNYVQGMNVIAAPFLFAAKSEVEAFSLFSVFVARDCPAYVKPTMEGVHRGLKLVDRTLAIVDPRLFKHLQSKFLTAELYAFASVLTLSACTPPLPEVLKLWDFLMAYGAHLNIVCVVAQLMLMRDDLLAAKSPMKLLRQFPPLNAKSVVSVAVSLVRKIPRDLWTEIVEHAL